MKTFFYRRNFIFIPFAIAAFLALIGLVVMTLWNILLPVILHVGTITFWQAIGLFILCKILFGFGKGGRGAAPWMRHKMAERFKSMSPEEKEKFKQQMMHRCGHGRWGGDWDNYKADAENANAETAKTGPSVQQ